MRQAKEKHVVIWEEMNVTFIVMTYRRLTKAELEQQVAFTISDMRRRRKLPKRNTSITVWTVIG